MNELTEANRKHWDGAVPIHVASKMYDVDGFRAGRSTLKPVELEELGDVRGRSLLHLQCHFGLDTLSWAREGAAVTGADFSAPAIEAARALAAECAIDARFVVSDIYALPEHLDGQFDIVFTSYGVLCWLSDVQRWAEIAAGFVKPGGTFYIAEFHPFSQIFDDAPDVDDLRVRYPYFPTGEPLRFENTGTYTDGGGELKNTVTYEWSHPVSEVLTALINAGLRIELLHAFPHTTFRFVPIMEPVDGARLLRPTEPAAPLPGEEHTDDDE